MGTPAIRLLHIIRFDKDDDKDIKTSASYDDDDDDDGNKHKHDDLHITLAAVRKIVESPPETWEKYRGQPTGLWDILEMEMRELMTAYVEMKSGVKSHADFVKELLHVSAAASQAYAKMTCPDKRDV
jgi:hypothetical protein